jgi:hypothetical protein
MKRLARFATQDGIPAVARAAWAPIDASRHTDEVGEATVEGAQRRAADRETDLGDAEVATTQQCQHVTGNIAGRSGTFLLHHQPEVARQRNR